MRLREFRLALIGVVCIAAAPEVVAQANSARQPIAFAEGQPIYEQDLMPAIGAQLLQLRNQEYELEIKAVRTIVSQRLVEKEASRKGLSVDAYLEQMVDKNLPSLTPGEIEAYYLAQRDRITQPLDQVRPQLEQSLLQARKQKARQDYMNSLQQSAAVSILLDRPRVDVAPDPERLRGNPDAPVTIVEFADYECPYCRQAEQTLNTILEKYKGKVRVSFRDFPLQPIHAQARKAAEASRCAGEQGKYWEYHDLLFANQSGLDENGLREYARKTALDPERFTACLEGRKFAAPIDGDIRAGTLAGVTGTPTFYVNGVALTGVQPVSAFENLIDGELAKVPGKSAAP